MGECDEDEEETVLLYFLCAFELFRLASFSLFSSSSILIWTQCVGLFFSSGELGSLHSIFDCTSGYFQFLIPYLKLFLTAEQCQK